MQLKYHMVTIEDLVPENHFLRKLEAALDLSFVYEETAHLYSRRYGRAPIDPVVMVKYLLLGFLYGIPENYCKRRNKHRSSAHTHSAEHTRNKARQNIKNKTQNSTPYLNFYRTPLLKQHSQSRGKHYDKKNRVHPEFGQLIQ